MTDAKIQDDRDRESDLPIFIKAWFAIGAVVALAPPLYWWADGRTTTIVGVPAALFYFLAAGLCIASSIVVAEILSHAEDAAS